MLAGPAISSAPGRSNRKELSTSTVSTSGSVQPSCNAPSRDASDSHSAADVSYAAAAVGLAVALADGGSVDHKAL